MGLPQRLKIGGLGYVQLADVFVWPSVFSFLILDWLPTLKIL